MFTEPNNSLRSLRRTPVPFIEYALPTGVTSRLSVTSSNPSSLPAPEDAEKANCRSALSNVTETLAAFPAPSNFDPFQIKSLPPFPRIDFIDCSPSTNRNDSTTFDFPDPLGPTIAVIGVSKESTVFFAKDLNPASSNFFSIDYM